MKTAIIVHGMPSKEEYYNPNSPAQSNKHWIPWLQRKLILNDVLTQTPEMPEPYAPNYEKWSSVFEQFKLGKNSTLIGHSCGAGFLVRYLSEHKAEIEKLILVAPWLDPAKELKSKMFSFDIDPALQDRCKEIVVIYSTDDGKEILDSVNLIRQKTESVSIKEFTDRGHFTYGDMKTEEFPELLEAALR